MYVHATIRSLAIQRKGLIALSLYQQYMSCHVLIDESCMEIKTEADSNYVTECSHDDKTTIGVFGFTDISHIDTDVNVLLTYKQ